MSKSSPQTQIRQLANGLTIIAEPMADKTVAAFTFLIPAGSATEPLGKEGLTGVLEGVCYRGAGTRNARQLSEALDDLGISREGGAGVEYTTFGGATLGLYLQDALDIYADIILRPVFPADDWEAERELALQGLRGLEDNPRAKMFVDLRQAFFTSAHRRPTIGTVEGLQSLTLDDLKADHAARFRPEGVILALAGQVDFERVCEQIERLFGEWSGSAPALEAPRTVEEPLFQHLDSEKAQQHIAVAYRAVDAPNPHNYDYRLAMSILSGGMGARLFTEVREKRGLVYSVSANANTHRGLGYTLAYAGTTPERAQETLDVLVAELQRMKEGVEQDELDRARIKMLTSLVMSEESSRARAGAIARDYWLLGRVRSLDEIQSALEAVTPESIAEFYARYPVGEASIVTLGPTRLERPA